MRDDHNLKAAVLEHLDIDPSVNSSHIGVAVRNGVVTLSGHVPSVGEKRSAVIVACQVKGVRAVVDELLVELPSKCETADEIVADRVSSRLESNKAVPTDRVRVSVEKGVVTLRGDVDWPFQREAAEQDLLHLDCIRELRNEIGIKPPVAAESISERIEGALDRIGAIRNDTIQVAADGSRVTLSGTANSWHEKDLAERAAWSVPGVASVVNEIDVV
jgi:osmotically-inducible protein OsmY